MNERFWDMPKEKQDRIMNASIAVFADQGYDRASTDEMVKRAGISKGLLFHYFVSKQGLYQFLYSYCSRFMKLELAAVKEREKEGFFERCMAVEQAKGRAMKQYPCIQLFLEKAESEDGVRIGGDFAALRKEYGEFCRGLYIPKEECPRAIAANYADWMNTVSDVTRGAMNRSMQNGEIRLKAYFCEISRIFGMLEVHS